MEGKLVSVEGVIVHSNQVLVRVPSNSNLGAYFFFLMKNHLAPSRLIVISDEKRERVGSLLSVDSWKK